MRQGGHGVAVILALSQYDGEVLFGDWFADEVVREVCTVF